MKITVLCFSGKDYLVPLRRYLRGKIFHVTSRSGFEGILQAGKISGDRRLPSNGHAQVSFGRSRGWVCLFDFVNTTVSEQKEGVGKCTYFPPPSVLNEDDGDCRVRTFVCLIISKNFYKKITPNAIAKKLDPIEKSGLYVPNIECWSEQSIPLKHIECAIQVSIKTKVSPVQRCLETVAKLKQQEKKTDIYARGE